MIRLALRAAFPILLLAGCASEPQTIAAPQPAHAESGLEIVPLSIETAKGRKDFHVEVAASVEQQAQGLMFRPPLAADRGMIFPFPTPRIASFWMKNTPSPLDLLFIRPDGTIARIAVMAEPYSLDPIQSGEPVSAVLEIAGGGAEQLGIAEGDRVSWQGQPAAS